MSNYTFAEIEALWRQAGGSAIYAPMAAAVALAESGGNPNAVNKNKNGSTDRGLWQINSIHGSQSTFNAVNNARAAIAISNNGTTWRAWATAWSDSFGSTYLGAGAPALDRLPAGASTGTAPSGTASADTSTPALKAIAFAYSQIGLPYKYGTEEPGKEFDCSGLVQAAYGKAGINLPRTAALQQAATTRISKTELRPGDLVFYGAPAHHVALYIGGGYLIQAPQTGEKVDKVKVWGTPTNYGRVKGSDAQQSTGVVANPSTDSTVSDTSSEWWNPLTWGSDVSSTIKDSVVFVLRYAWWFAEGLGGVLLLTAGFGFLVMSAATGEGSKSEPPETRVVVEDRRAPELPEPRRQPIRARAETPVPRARRRPQTALPAAPERKVIEGEVL